METPKKVLNTIASPPERSSIKVSKSPQFSYLSKNKKETDTSMSINSFEMTELKDSLFGFTVNISDIDLCSFQSDSVDFGRSIFTRTDDTLEEGALNNLKSLQLILATKQITFREPKNNIKIQPKDLQEPSIEDPSFNINEIQTRISKSHCSSLCTGYLLAPTIEYSDTSLSSTPDNFYIANILKTVDNRQACLLYTSPSPRDS